MSGIVYYLSFFAEGAGFLFPDELPANYYSPGLFLVLPSEDGTYAYSYSFDAMDNGQRVTLKLVRVEEDNPRSSLYAVKTKNYGSFWFNLREINPKIRYMGGRRQLRKHGAFSVAISTDDNKLERTCNDFNFYFIGSTLRDGDS